MGKVDWTNAAKADVRAIYDFIAKDSVEAAGRVRRQIQQKAKWQSLHPMIGRMVPEIEKPAFRECFVMSYRLVYEVEKTRILILRVLHQAQDREKPL